MDILANKRIILAVTGGIAAYKSAELVRRLRRCGAEVQVVMTQAAAEFVTPLTFQALSGRPVRTELFDTDAEAAMGHIELARWADAILVAPCSANTLAKLAQGLADDLLTTLCLASDAPLAIAPAMNRLMWSNPATRSNLDLLQTRDVQIFGPGDGDQACGETGEGRMLEPEELADKLEAIFKHHTLAGQRVTITAGPTCEAIDPVRFISNRSSGKMGFALAAAATEAGADVTLISGPVQLETPAGVRRIDVISATEMLKAVMANITTTDIFIACAAVADYRLQTPATSKLKKNAEELQLGLIKNPDILAEVAALPEAPFTLGFAAETEDLKKNAQAKLRAKGIDMIAANQVGHKQGFDTDHNALEVFWQSGQHSLPQASKYKLARALIKLLADQYDSKSKTVHKTENINDQNP